MASQICSVCRESIVPSYGTDFFHFVCRTIFIISSMINVCSYAPSYTIDTFPFYYITFSSALAHFPQIGGLPSLLSEHLLAM